MTQLTVGSLFSGIGGLDLGLERAGMRVVWQSEIDDYACRVLKKHWPDTPNIGDIKEVDWNTIERPDVICGGYPCQPFSLAGQRKGEQDERHLWPYVREAISVLRPQYAILENVRGHLSLGGLSVIGELATIGYDAEWRVVSAASVGANHRRDRIIIVAYPNFSCETDGRQCSAVQGEDRSRGNDRAGSDTDSWQVTVGSAGETCSQLAYPDSEQLGQRRFTDDAGQKDRRRVYYGIRQEGYVGWQWWEVEPDVGRVADGVSYRVDRLRGLGNAVVPQVAEVIGRLVVAHWAQERAEMPLERL